MVTRRTLISIISVSLILVLSSLQYGFYASYLQFDFMQDYFKYIQRRLKISVVSKDTRRDANWNEKYADETRQATIQKLMAKNSSSGSRETITRHNVSSNEVPSEGDTTTGKVLDHKSANKQQNIQPLIAVQQLKSNLRFNSLETSDKISELKGGQRIANIKVGLPVSPPRHDVGSVRNSTCNGCFAHNFKYIINNENICKKVNTNQSIDLIIMILTTHGNLEARNALRETWLTYSNKNTANIRYVFLLGEINDKALHDRVVEESKKYNDIIKEDFTDTYMNLTYKTIMGFKWIVNHCSIAKYVIKTDDDMYINIPNILKYIRTKGHTLDNNLAGSCGAGAPNRNVKSKWYASVLAYREPRYPGFCSGTAYLTSMNIATKIYDISPIIPFFHLEDVYVGLCVKKLGGYIINLRGFNRDRVRLDPCLYKSDKLYTSHLMTPTTLYSVWKGICKSSIIKHP